MFYVIQSSYAGPNPDQHLNENKYYITTTPGRTNLGNQVVTNGWLGQTGDWNSHAYGVFETLDEAKAALTKLTGGSHREIPVDRMDEDEVYCVLDGAYEDLDRETSEAWTYDELYRSITAETTDEQISEMLSLAEKSANEDGKSLDLAHLEGWFLERRDELKSNEA
jgi:hypothetical protein